MKSIIVKNQEELLQVLVNEAYITIILDGGEFTIPDQKLLTGFEFIGKRANTSLTLVGTSGYSFSKASKGNIHNINQLAPFGGITAVKNLHITSIDPLELAFQDREEYTNWQSSTIDRDKVDIVFIDETLDYFTSQSKSKSPAEQFFDDLLEGLLN